MKYLTYLKVLAFALVCFGSHAEAKSSGFSSSSRSSSSSSSSSSRSSGSSWGSSSKSTATAPKATAAPSSNSYSKPGTSAAQTSTRPTSKADVARYQASAKSGKTFATRESAVADFKAKNADKMTSKYTSEPSQRPSHIPTTYADSSGTRRDIVYNQAGGGYGYYSGGGPGLGTFMMYDALSDAAMMNTMMSRQNYYVGPPPQIGWSVGKIFLVVLGSCLGLFAIIALFAWFND
jgi:hypothetical protein